MIVSENVMGHLKYKWTLVGKGNFFFFLVESIYTSYLKNIKINVMPLNVSLKPTESISGQICQKKVVMPRAGGQILLSVTLVLSQDKSPNFNRLVLK